MDRQEAKGIIETILFVADTPIRISTFVELLNSKYADEEIIALLNELKEYYDGRVFQLVEIAGGWRMQTRKQFGPWITAYYKTEHGQKLSRASLEVLAIVSYRQPITRTEVDDIRGVDSGGVLRGLIDKGLVRIMGRRKLPGRPIIYGTTVRFLEYFGLSSLADMPTLDEFNNELDSKLSDNERQAIISFSATNPKELNGEENFASVKSDQNESDETSADDNINAVNKDKKC